MNSHIHFKLPHNHSPDCVKGAQNTETHWFRRVFSRFIDNRQPDGAKKKKAPYTKAAIILGTPKILIVLLKP